MHWLIVKSILKGGKHGTFALKTLCKIIIIEKKSSFAVTSCVQRRVFLIILTIATLLIVIYVGRDIRRFLVRHKIRVEPSNTKSRTSKKDVNILDNLIMLLISKHGLILHDRHLWVPRSSKTEYYKFHPWLCYDYVLVHLNSPSTWISGGLLVRHKLQVEPAISK